jgi:hypothetical protein
MALPNDERARAIAYLLVHSRRHCRDLSYGRQVRLKRYQEWESREAERATRNASQQ